MQSLKAKRNSYEKEQSRIIWFFNCHFSVFHYKGKRGRQVAYFPTISSIKTLLKLPQSMALCIIGFWPNGIRINTSNVQIKPISKWILHTKSPLWAYMCDTTNISNLIISKPDCFIFIYWQTGVVLENSSQEKCLLHFFFFFLIERRFLLFNNQLKYNYLFRVLKNCQNEQKQMFIKHTYQFYPPLPAAFLQGHVSHYAKWALNSDS